MTASFSAFDFAAGGEPGPSTAAGPANLIAMVDHRIGIFSKDGSLLEESALTNALGANQGFFEDVDRDGAFSPAFDTWVTFDPTAGVFFAVAIQSETGAGANEAQLLIAVSTSATPDDLDVAPNDQDQDWYFYSLPATHVFGTYLCKIDNPRLAVDDSKLYVSGSYFSFSGFAHRGEAVFHIDKAPLLSGTLGDWSLIEAPGASRLRPAAGVGQPPAGGQFFVEALSTNQGLRIWQMSPSGQLSIAATLSAPFTIFPTTGVPQQGTTKKLKSMSPYLLNAVWQGGSIWTAHTVKRSTGEATVRWYEIDTTDGNFQIAQTGDVSPGAGIHTFMPAIAVNNAGDMVLTYTQSSVSQFPAMMAAGRQASYPPGFLDQATVVRLSDGYFAATSGSVQQWGDHGGIAVDPVDDSIFWSLHEYATSDPTRFATWLAGYRPTPADVVLQAVAAGQGNLLTISYSIVTNGIGPFDIGFYRSADSIFTSGSDEQLGTIRIEDQADLLEGSHVKSVPIGGQPGEIPLPGAGGSTTAADYYLLAVADPVGLIPEHDADSITDDNLQFITGVYQSSAADLVVSGSSGGDLVIITVDQSGQLNVALNGVMYSLPEANVPGLELRLLDGNDVFDASGISKPVTVWGGAGNDSITGSQSDDLLIGGLGDDSSAGGGGQDRWWIDGSSAGDTITISPDTVAGRVKSVRGSETDRLAYDSQDRIEVYGGAGNDRLTVSTNITVPARLDGGPGNDTLQGGGGPDSLMGGEGADKLLGKFGSDDLDGGPDADGATFEGTNGSEFLDVFWNGSQLILTRRQTATSAVLETDRGSNLESLTILGLAGNDTLRSSGLSELDLTSAGLTGLLLDGGAGNDSLLGSQGNDSLQGGLGNDTLDGGGGADLWLSTGTSAADDLSLVLSSASALGYTRKAVGSATILETDIFLFDSLDQVLLQALGGNDIIHVAADVPIVGTVDGGAGTDTASVPAGWQKQNCEG